MSRPSEPSTTIERRNHRKVAFATIVGTTVEWYDFFIYAQAAALVFSVLYFEPAGNQAGLLLAFASIGISFLFRPLGAIAAGYLGDRYGRRAVLVATLLLMGIATSAIGLLPTYDSIGITAPIILVLLRILQGISAGGEWGGAVLMAVEHAPRHRRGLFGSYPQLGVPLGMLLATGVMALMTGYISPGDAFMEWGWRVPFLFSIVLIAVGHFVRRSVDESPVFTEMAARAAQTRTPVTRVFKTHGALIVVAALLFAGMNAAGYVATGGFISSYATNVDGPVGLPRTQVLIAVVVAAAVWGAFTVLAGVLSDRIGRKNTYLLGYGYLIILIVPIFLLVNTGSIWLLTLALCLLTIGLGLTYGPQSAWFAELFPAAIRFSGISAAFALGSILGGAFAPLIAQALLNGTGTVLSVALYLAAMFIVSISAAIVLRDRRNVPLGIDHQDQQNSGATIFSARSETVTTPSNAETETSKLVR